MPTQYAGNKYLLFFILTLLAAYPALSTDLYLPSLPAISAFYHCSNGIAELTLTFYLIAFAFGLLLLGPLSDKIGRKYTLILGNILFLASCIGSIFSLSIIWLILLRIIQALGACTATMTIYAVVRDLYIGKAATRLLSAIATIMNIGVAFAPVVGGILQEHFGWKSNFIALSVYSALTLIMVTIFFRETLAETSKEALFNTQTFKNYYQLLVLKPYILPMIPVVLAFSSYFIFLYISPFLYIHTLGTSPAQYGRWFLIPAFAFVVGSAIATALIQFLESYTIYKLGAITFVMGTILMLLGYLTASIQMPMLIALNMGICAIGIAMIIPSCVSLALSSITTKVGSASALIGFLQFGTAGLVGYSMSLNHHDLAFVMSATLMLFSIFCISMIGKIKKQQMLSDG